jgi:hypothetical protein
MATMTWQDLLNLQNQNPGASRAQLAAIWQQQGGVTTPTPSPTPPPGTPPDVSGGSVNPTPTSSPTPAPTPAPTGSTPTNASAKAFFDQTFPGQTLTPQMLLDNEAALNAQGIKLVKNAAGQPGKISLPDGTTYDVIQGAGSGQNLKQWLQISGPGGDTSGFGGGGGSSANAADWGPVGQMLGNLGYSVGGVFAPWTQTWQTPTADQALNYPGVQFAMNNAMRLMQNSAAAQGVLGNARAQEAISQNLGQSLLGQYQNIRGMALGDYLQNQQDFFANQDRPWNKFYQGTSLGINAAQLG